MADRFQRHLAGDRQPPRAGLVEGELEVEVRPRQFGGLGDGGGRRENGHRCPN
jgi:hypothetical protein